MYLASNIYLAAVDDRSVILDLARDKYVGLGAAATRAINALLYGPPPESDPSLDAARRSFLERGYLSERPPIEDRAQIDWGAATLWPSQTSLSNAEQSLVRPPSAKEVWANLAALAESTVRLQTSPLLSTLEWVRKTPVRDHPTPEDPQAVLDAYFAARPWFPIKPICRLDAIALCVQMRRRGVGADLVFGVRLRPFGAHCWVQHDDVVINEPHESVRQFTPIMKV